jgi:hypothetical protein
LNGDKIDDETKAILVGERIEIRLQSETTGATYSDFTWTVPSDAFKDWRPNDKGRVVRLGEEEDHPDDDLHRGSCIFYCAGPGRKTVTVNCKLDSGDNEGQYKTFSSTIEVIRPGSTITPMDLGISKLKGLQMKLTDTTIGDDNGIRLQGSIQMPGDRPAGSWAWLQCVTPSRLKTNSQTGYSEADPNNNVLCLDANFPYIAPGDERPSTRSTNETHEFRDAPGTRWINPTPITEITVADLFSLYLMFKPSGDTSKYVPIKRLDWTWPAFAYGHGLDPTNWVVIPTTASINADSEVAAHPNWTRVIANH